tara:strand:- start:344 stop:799 length:456 start_codon:yes stop_codon:yes gene_type:complete
MGLNIGAGGEAGSNYVEAASFYPKYEGSTGNLFSSAGMYLSTRENTNTSLISLTDNDRRITFAKACKVWLTACNDIDCNTDSGYSHFNIRKNGNVHTQMLVRNTTEWDQWMGHDFIECDANDYIHFEPAGTGSITAFNRAWGAWSVLCFFR